MGPFESRCPSSTMASCCEHVRNGNEIDTAESGLAELAIRYMHMHTSTEVSCTQHSLKTAEDDTRATPKDDDARAAY